MTWQPGSDVRYQDTTGKNGVLKAGGLEWMNAGGGAFHQGELLGHGRVTGFQLWVPMPPGLEDGPSFGQYVPPQDVQSLSIEGGSITVLLGEVREKDGVARSAIQSPHDIAYFVVDLSEGAVWRYAPSAQHDVAWAYGFEGPVSRARNRVRWRLPGLQWDGARSRSRRPMGLRASSSGRRAAIPTHWSWAEVRCTRTPGPWRWENAG